MNISIVIPNYNGEKLLQKNLPKVLDAIKDYKEGKVEVVISDDGSKDDSLTVIKKFLDEINDNKITGKMIENKKRSEGGFSKNVNRGVSASSGEILILLNTDVAPHADFLSPLLKHFENHDVFAVGCMDESRENGKTILRGRGVGSIQRGFLMHKKGDVEGTDTLWVSGGSGAFRKQIWDKLNGLDTLYNPFYWEDIDISYRALKAGYRTIFEPQSIVIHEHSEGAIMSEFSEKFVKKIAYRNQFIFYWKNVTDPGLLMQHVLWLPYHFIKALLRGDWELFEGFLHALTRFGKIMKARRTARKLFVKKDRDVLKAYV